MAKKSVETFGDMEPNERLKQLHKLVESMESYTKHRIECYECLASESERDVTEQRFARYLHEEGWRYHVGPKEEGVLCPECVKNAGGSVGGPSPIPGC
jgi:hypothetical protein